MATKKVSKKKEVKQKPEWYVFGRPQKYTPKSLYEKSQEYFAKCDDKANRLDKWMWGKVPLQKTLSGLCLHLKVSKDYISEKAKDDNFSEAIKEIRLNVENDLEIRTLQWVYNATSGIFNLKNNFWWVDKHEVDNNVNLTTKVVSLPDLMNDTGDTPTT